MTFRRPKSFVKQRFARCGIIQVQKRASANHTRRLIRHRPLRMLRYVEEAPAICVIVDRGNVRLGGGMCAGFGWRRDIVIKRRMVKWCRLLLVDHGDFTAHRQLVDALIRRLVEEVRDKLLQLFVFIHVSIGARLEGTDGRRAGSINH
jgi:hypothetical protein